MPLDSRPSMAASLCAGVGLLWHQSASVVVPQLSWLSAPMRVAMNRSSGCERGGQPGVHLRKYSSSVQLAATPRSAVCQVCMCALTRPGMTMQPARPPPARRRHVMAGAIARDALALHQQVGRAAGRPGGPW